MTLFTQRQQDLPRRRVAVLCMFLGGLLIAPAFGQTSSPRCAVWVPGSGTA